MKTLTLTRLIHTAHGIIGRMGEFYTLERRDLDNQPNISCITAGTYRAYRSFYNRGGYECFELENVPGRSEILIHIGNTEDDSAGCILVGSGVGVINSKNAVTASRVAFDAFMASLEGKDEFTLEIKEWNDA